MTSVLRFSFLVACAAVFIVTLRDAWGGATLVDPSADPAGFFDQLLTFGRQNWALGLGFGVYGLLELIAWLGRDVPSLHAIGQGRLTLVVGGSTAVLGALLNALVAGGSMQMALVAAVAALAAWWHPAAPDVAIAKAQRGRGPIIKDNRPPLVLAMLLGGSLVLGHAACGPKTAAAVQAAETCEENAAAKDLIPVVQAILADAASWQTILTSLAGSFGLDTINCAVAAAEAAIKAQHTASLDLTAVHRADEWLKEHGK
jgi:hypothetical protein